MPGALPHPTAHTVPPPVLFNAWKHHAGWVRGRIAAAADRGDDGLHELAAAVVITGTKLMDLYTGTLTPWELSESVVEQQRKRGRLDRPAFAEWVAEAGGYRRTELHEDGSRWVLRIGDAERYVHLHPARYSPHSHRVPGVSIKSAIMANALALTCGSPVADLATVNEARRRFLSLPPVARLTDDGGLGEVLRLLSPAA